MLNLGTAVASSENGRAGKLMQLDAIWCNSVEAASGQNRTGNVAPKKTWVKKG